MAITKTSGSPTLVLATDTTLTTITGGTGVYQFEVYVDALADGEEIRVWVEKIGDDSGGTDVQKPIAEAVWANAQDIDRKISPMLFIEGSTDELTLFARQEGGTGREIFWYAYKVA